VRLSVMVKLSWGTYRLLGECVGKKIS
jgi:hypothetical protein